MNRITELLGIEHPILLGAMAQICMGEFAAIVSNAGGLGVIASGGMTKDKLKEEIRICKSLTEKPFGVNIMLMNENKGELAQLLIDEGVAVAVTGAGNPALFIPMWKEAGIKIIPVIPSVKIAKKMEKLGVDAIVTEGTEAGGHIGETTTMALLPQVVDAVSIPVIGAGGIADGRAMVAAFALGAEAVQVGTRFIATKECPVHENYKKLVISASDTDTIITGRSLGGLVRGVKNPMSLKFAELEKIGASREEINKISVGALKRAVVDGDSVNGSVMAGQICGMVDEITSVEEVISSMISQAKELAVEINTTYLKL